MTQQEYLKRFKIVTERMLALTSAKGADYAGPDNPFKNFQLIEMLTEGRISTIGGIAVRLTDKLQRFINLLSRPPQVVEEKIEDTLLDNACYSIIAYIYLTATKAELFQVADEAPEVDNSDVPQDEETPVSLTQGPEDRLDFLTRKAETLGASSLSVLERTELQMLISKKWPDLLDKKDEVEGGA